jgi:hypothetical protein
MSATGAPRRWTSRSLAVAVALVLALAVAGCSSDDEADAPPATGGTVPSSTGDACTDPVGDLDLPVGVTADSPGISGVDLVEAEAVVEGDVLAITITTAAPIDDAPSPTFVVAQGDPLGALSFELRMERGADGWESTMITWPNSTEQRQPIDVEPTVEGDELRASLPLEGLPPIALVIQFGASAEVGNAVAIDDCSSLDS